MDLVQYFPKDKKKERNYFINLSRLNDILAKSERPRK
jgi:hypothetical protein